MNKLRNAFYNEISNLASQIQSLNKRLVEPHPWNLVSQADCDNLGESWTKIDSNAGLTDFISWREYRDLKLAKEELEEEVRTLLEYRNFEETEYSYNVAVDENDKPDEEANFRKDAKDQ